MEKRVSASEIEQALTKPSSPKQRALLLARLLTCPECGAQVLDQAYGHDCDDDA